MRLLQTRTRKFSSISDFTQSLSLLNVHLGILSILITISLKNQNVFAFQTSTHSVKVTASKSIERHKERFILKLNRIFAEKDEVIEETDGSLILKLKPTDNRFAHITKILKLNKGDTVKTGILDFGIYDFGKIINIPSKDSIKSDPTEDLEIHMGNINKLTTNKRPQIDLILAVPRPLRLERILTNTAMMGLGRLILVDAEKVEKDFFGFNILFLLNLLI
jgi:hypothetical protein